MKLSLLKTGIAGLFLCPLCSVPSPAAIEPAALEPAAALAQPLDRGPLTALGRGGETISVTLPLGLRDPAGAEAMMIRVATPGDALYHRFLAPEQIRAQFGPDETEVARASAILTLSGLSVERATATTLKVTGSVATVERVFQTQLHEFATPTATFRAPAVKPTVPPSIAGTVQGTIGLGNGPALRSQMRTAQSEIGGKPVAQSGTASTGTAFGSLTVRDFAQLYDVNRLYAQGVTGAGRTLAIVTLAAFTPSDAQLYWDTLGLDTKPNRITIVDVDGGPGAPSDASGSGETTLDVEQSGGIAPQADIIVYQAPNTAQSIVDVFAAAVEANIADSISISWGASEVLAEPALNGDFVDPLSGEMTSAFQAIHNVLVLGALQGQSSFAAAGDSGAFPTNFAGFTNPLSLLWPADDTALTSAGGTTLPGTQTFAVPGNQTVVITLPAERAWGWDYLEPFCAGFGVPDPVACGIFSAGTGGGVSIAFPVPPTQIGLPGVQRSQPGQSLTDETTSPPTDFFDLPANFAGRNVPDVEFNADPETGYAVFVTSDVKGFEILSGIGGTSFVAPQLNGVTALLGQNAGHRLGLLNVPIYLLARTGIATLGPNPALHVIATGDNWFYTARNGYSPVGGLGTIDVANLAALLK